MTIDLYLPEKWRGNTDCLGYVMWCVLNEQPDMYHFDTYGEHVEEWNVIL
jgi:hypothetical protein